jgi:hypothetical protein
MGSYLFPGRMVSCFLGKIILASCSGSDPMLDECLWAKSRRNCPAGRMYSTEHTEWRTETRRDPSGMMMIGRPSYCWTDSNLVSGTAEGQVASSMHLDHSQHSVCIGTWSASSRKSFRVGRGAPAVSSRLTPIIPKRVAGTLDRDWGRGVV